MNNKSIFLNVCLITLTFLASILVIHLLSMSMFIIKHREANYYMFKKDKIPSIYKVNGKRNLYYYRSSNKRFNETKIFKYKDVDDVKSDLTNYINELKDNYNFTYTSDIDLTDYNSPIELSALSTEPNKIIIMTITFKEEGYTIKITKGQGNINFYE